MRRAKAALTDDERRRQSAELSRRLLSHPALVSATTLLLYHPLSDEIDISPVVDALSRDRRKTILLPRVTSPTDMELRLYHGRESLLPGAYGIMEPTGPLFTHYEAIDVAVVPGMAFDRLGHRLGRGRGYYDRLLPRLTRARLIGVGFGCQLVATLATTPTDVAMHEVLT